VHYSYQLLILTAITFLVHIHLQHLGVRDVLVGCQKEHHIALLILDGHNVEQTPEGGTCNVFLL